MNHAYRLSTLKLVSDIELPELMEWDRRSEISAELVFRLGKLPARLEAPEAPLVRTEGRSRYLLISPNDARILIENGSTVTIELAPGTDLTKARSILMAPVQGVLWHQRGLLPLHASAVSVDGRVLAIAGPAGAGKSTLAAALSAKGHSVIADDICIIDATDGAHVLAGTQRLRLWRDALDHFGIAVEGLPRALSRREKYWIEARGASGCERQKLVAVALLSRQECGSVTIEPLRGARSVVELAGALHMLPAAQALGLQPAVFAALTKLAAAGVTVWRLVMPNDWACLDEAAAKVLEILDG